MRPSIALAAMLLITLLPADVRAADEWFDWSLHHRVPADVSAGSYGRMDWIVEERVNFSAFNAAGGAPFALDPDSIRVVEYAADGMVAAEAVSQFDADEPGSSSGELLWKVAGLLERGESRRYYIYFNALGDAAIAPANYTREVIVRNRKDDVRIDSSQLMLFMDRAYGYTHIVKKAAPWANAGDPAANDPLAASRENVSRFRGFLSGPGEHACDPGCEWRFANATITVLYDGPLRATIDSASPAILDRSTNETRPFASSTITQVYAGVPYYRMKKSYGFGDQPGNVSGLNRRTWFYGFSHYAYPAPEGVREGDFPATGTEFSDWNGTWDDASDGSTGIADIELSSPLEPHSLWIERDGQAGISYLGALWRPGFVVSEDISSDTVYYFHSGDWRAGNVSALAAALTHPPPVAFGSASSFLLAIAAPEAVLNWNPTLPVFVRVEGNRSPVAVSCRVVSTETGQLFFNGTVSGGIDIFNLPAGGLHVTCVARDASGSSEFASADSMVYDVMTIASLAAAVLAAALLLAGAYAYRFWRGLLRPENGPPCRRCGMPLRAGARSCPVCGARGRRQP